MRAHIAYINYTKQLRIFHILHYFCVVYISKTGNRLEIPSCFLVSRKCICIQKMSDYVARVF